MAAHGSGGQGTDKALTGQRLAGQRRSSARVLQTELSSFAHVQVLVFGDHGKFRVTWTDGPNAAPVQKFAQQLIADGRVPGLDIGILLWDRKSSSGGSTSTRASITRDR